MLLLDQNLSHRLVDLLARDFPRSAHVKHFQLEQADDEIIWRFAAEHGYTIVSKDEDFHQRSFVYGAPPKVIWLRLGNCSTEEIAAKLRESKDAITRFLGDPEAAFLIIS